LLGDGVADAAAAAGDDCDLASELTQRATPDKRSALSSSQASNAAASSP
jgi:hypothetical protein